MGAGAGTLEGREGGAELVAEARRVYDELHPDKGNGTGLGTQTKKKPTRTHARTNAQTRARTYAIREVSGRGGSVAPALVLHLPRQATDGAAKL